MTSKAQHGQGRGCVITRRACFSSSHRYWLPELSEEDNKARFGPCSIAPGHGHNYELIVSMAGGLDADGMVLNLSDVKQSIRSRCQILGANKLLKLNVPRIRKSSSKTAIKDLFIKEYLE